MSRKIDLSKPLSEDDRQYLVDRNRWDDLREADGDKAEVPEPRDPNSSPPTVDTPPTLHPTDAGTLTAEALTKPLPDVSTAAAAEPATGESENNNGDNYDDSDAWSFADLQDEAKTRDPSISAKGSREEIVARLRESDKAN